MQYLRWRSINSRKVKYLGMAEMEILLHKLNLFLTQQNKFEKNFFKESTRFSELFDIIFIIFCEIL